MKLKSSVVTVILVLVCISCMDNRPSVSLKPAFSVVCSPEKLPQGEWATITLLQMYPREQTPVEIRKEKLEKLALFAKKIEIKDEGANGAYRLQVFAVKPLGKSLTLDNSYFENLTSSNTIKPISITVVEGE